MNETSTKPQNSKLIRIVIIAFLALAGIKAGLDLFSKKLEGENIYSISDLKHDDSTYKYVKQKCEEGFFPPDHENCKNMREARQ